MALCTFAIVHIYSILARHAHTLQCPLSIPSIFLDSERGLVLSSAPGHATLLQQLHNVHLTLLWVDATGIQDLMYHFGLLTHGELMTE